VSQSLACLLVFLTTAGSAIGDDTPLHAQIDYRAIEAEVAANIDRLGLSDAAAERIAAFTRETASPLIFPVRTSDDADQFLVHHISNYVDLDSRGPGFLLDFSCWSRTYDLDIGYNHAGTDIVVGPFRWQAMDARQGEVIAAAGGLVVAKFDGRPDRECGGNLGAEANYFVLLQDDGLHAYYYHLASGSLADFDVGHRVEAGEFLGIAGSSGTSTEPHLHFELRNGLLYTGSAVDPYAGPCGASVSLWRHQHAGIDSGIRALYTHSSRPLIQSDSCVEDTPNLQNLFQPGDPVSFGVYLRDQNFRSRPDLEILRPDGSVEVSTTLGEARGLTPAARQFLDYTLPGDAAPGRWRMRATYRGHSRERAFYVGSAPVGEARLRSAVLPSSRSVQAETAATVFATVINPSTRDGMGCWIYPAMPFDGSFAYRATDPVTNAVTGGENVLFDIPAGQSRTFILAFTSNPGAVARSLDMPLRYRCDNADNAPQIGSVNTVTLSIGPSPVPDMISVGVTPSSDGVLRIPGQNASAAFAVATANVGAAGSLTVEPRGLGGAAALRLRICETDSATGACLAPPEASIERTYNAGETASFAVFAAGQGEAVPFNPASARVMFEATDSLGNVRGSTSVAVRTD